MIKTLHEDRGVEIVNTVQYLVTEKLAALSSWQVEASQSNDIAFKLIWNRLMVVPDALDAVTELRTFHATDSKMPNFAQ